MHFEEGRHSFPDDFVMADRDILMEGEGPGESVLVVSPGAAIRVNQRRHKTGCSLIVRDLSIVLDGVEDTAVPPLQIIGPGTENLGQQMVHLQNVQFGHRDARPTGHPTNPGPLRGLPESWVQLTGVYGSVWDHCHFASQWRGGRHDSWSDYQVKNAVLFSSGEAIEDIDGSMHPPHTMRNEFRSCYFGTGIGNCVFVGPGCWVEGLTLDKCHATDVWRLLHLSTNETNKGKGTSITVRDCDVAFNCEAIGIDTGAGIRIVNNYFLPLPGGDFWSGYGGELSAHILLGDGKRDYGPHMTLITGNIFGMTSSSNKPKYAVSAMGGTFKVRLAENFYQACEPVYCGDLVDQVWVDGERVR